MAVYNAAQFLREAVSSVLAQTYSDFELLAVDDCSSDHSVAVLESFADPRLRIIHHQRNLGAAQSRNDALAAARGELVAIMDADDVCARNRLERQVAYLDAHPLVGLVGCGIYHNIDPTGRVLYTSYLPEDNEAIQRTLVKRWCFLHSSITFRKRLQKRTGGYRAEFEGAEDHDFLLRMLEHCQAHNIYEPLVSYRISRRGLSVTAHQYINEFGDVAMRLALRRRSGHLENLEAELATLLVLKQRRNAGGGVGGAVQKLLDSLYAAERFYGFGCRELYAGRPLTARRCFGWSLRTNPLFWKSWIGIALSVMPFVADHLKFAFRASMWQYNELSRLKTDTTAYNDGGHS